AQVAPAAARGPGQRRRRSVGAGGRRGERARSRPGAAALERRAAAGRPAGRPRGPELRRDRRGARHSRRHGDVAAGAGTRPAAHADGLGGRRQGRSCGTAEGEMTPERNISEAELHAYLDSELTAEDRADVEALLAAAPAEAGLVRDFRDLNEALRERYAGRLEE